MEFTTVADALDGIPNMTRDQGEVLYRHLVDSRAVDVLELGTAHGVSASYAAAALEYNGAGRVVTVDNVTATTERDPQPADVIKKCGLDHRVERVLNDDSSYTWWLKQQVARQSDADGNCEPLFDFCYLDGAHNWTIDGLAVILVEKLLRPGGWLLLDDLNWSYDPTASSFGPGQGPADLHLSASECAEPHMRAVYEILVRQHPSFSTFVEQDGEWGWARKAPSAPRTFTVERSASTADRVRGRIGGAMAAIRGPR